MDMTWPFLASLSFLFTGAAGAVVYVRRLRAELERQEGLVRGLERDMQAVCVGARGMGEAVVILRHGLRNALMPVLTAVSGWFASLLAGAVFVEYVFGWKGMGLEVFNALEREDFPVVMGAVLVFATIFVVMNVMVDLLYAVLDPRVRTA